MKKTIKLLVLLTLLTGCNNKKEEKLEYIKNIDINVGKELPSLNKYLDKKYINELENKEINWEDINLEENKIYLTGKYTGTFKYKEKEYKIYVNVKDNEKPVIENVKNIEIYVNDKIDLLKDIKVTDNSHDKIDTVVDGKYDISKKGEYNLKYIATDKSNNKEEKEFKLIVKEKPVIKNEISNSSKDVPMTTSKGYKVKNINGLYYINGTLIANKTYSLPSSYNPGGLTTTFNTSFSKMNEQAKNDGINLRIISGFRSYNTQSTLYNNYVKRDGVKAADTYSARAGHSEHQTGLAADINSLEQNFINTKEGKWLNENCYKYGFIIRFPKGKENITGYMYEPWHIRYVGEDIATKLYNNGNWQTLEEYFGITSNYQ